MRAKLVHKADAVLGVAKGDELFAEQLHAHRRAIGLGQFARHQRRHPITPQHLAHRGSRSDPGDQLVVFA